MSLTRRLQRAETILAARTPSPAGGDDMTFYLWISAVGECGPAALPRLSGTMSRDPADWSAFFSTWTVFAAVSDAWQARGEVPPDDFLADAPAAVRVRTWHLAGANPRDGREQSSQLSKFTLLILHALDLPFGREDRERMADRPALPAEVRRVFLDDAEAVPSHDCAECGVFLPVRPGQQGGPEPVIYYTACPLCGGRVGYDLFRWREQHAASAAAARGDRDTRRAVEAAAGQQDDAEAGAQADAPPTHRPVGVGRVVRRDDDGPDDFGLAAGRPRRPLF
jgi:hypothetical protein